MVQDLLGLTMKKILLFFLINSIFLSYSKAEILILACSFNNSPNSNLVLHIDTDKQRLIQTDTLKLDPAQVALKRDSKFTIIKSSLIDNSEMKTHQNRFNDNAVYDESQMFMEINRYSGDFDMYVLFFDRNNFDFFLTKINEIKNSENLFREMEIFAEKNNRPGFRYDDFGDGVCKKSNKQF